MSTMNDNTASRTFSNDQGTFVLSEDGTYVTATWTDDGTTEILPVVPPGTPGAVPATDYVEGAPDIWVDVSGN